MIQVGTTLKVMDNSGAREVYCIGVLKGFKQRYSFIGDIITVAVKKLRIRRRALSKVKKGAVLKALIIRTKSGAKLNGNITSFFENAVLLLNNKNKLLGTRIFGPLPKILRYTKHLRLTFLAIGVIN